MQITSRAPAGVRGRPRLVPLPEAGSHAFMVSRSREPTVHFLWYYHHE